MQRTREKQAVLDIDLDVINAQKKMGDEEIMLYIRVSDEPRMFGVLHGHPYAMGYAVSNFLKEFADSNKFERKEILDDFLDGLTDNMGDNTQKSI